MPTSESVSPVVSCMSSALMVTSVDSSGTGLFVDSARVSFEGELEIPFVVLLA